MYKVIESPNKAKPSTFCVTRLQAIWGKINSQYLSYNWSTTIAFASVNQFISSTTGSTWHSAGKWNIISSFPGNSL